MSMLSLPLSLSCLSAFYFCYCVLWMNYIRWLSFDIFFHLFKSLILKFDWFKGLSYLHNKCMSSFMNVYLVLWLGFQVWTDELFKLATNILSQNASRNTFLFKAWVLCVCVCLNLLFKAKWHVSVAKIHKSLSPLHWTSYRTVACDYFF